MSSQQKKSLNEWRQAKNLNDILYLIDIGVVLKWSELKAAFKLVDEEESQKVLEYLSQRICERYDMRLSAEILVETLLIWLSNPGNEKNIGYFLERMFEHPACESAFYEMISIIMNFETAEKERHEDIFYIGVALVCELGMAVKQVSQAYKELLKDSDKLLEYISAYLLSVSNYSNNCVRLSLVNYFGVMEHGSSRPNFHKIMGRFGHTILEHLFNLLFDKKTESVSLKYFKDNFAFILDTEIAIQKTIFETLKLYMLKYPDRFMLFINCIVKQAMSDEWASTEHAKSMLFKHLSVLYKVVAEVNHKKLASEILESMERFQNHSFFIEGVQVLQQDITIKRPFRELLQTLVVKPAKGKVQFISKSQRGRKPSFAKESTMLTVEQVVYLGNIDTAKAS